MIAWIILLIVVLAGSIFFLRLRIRLKTLASNVGEMSSQLREKAHSASEEKNKIFFILESLAEGVALIDDEQKIALANSALASALSLPKLQLEGRYFWELFRDPYLNEMIVEALKNRHAAQKEQSILLSESVFQIRVSPVFAGDAFLGVVAVFYDVTRLKELERLRSEFVANVSHELKTPLTSIMGYVETLKEGAIDDTQNRVKFLEIIEDQSKKLYRMIEDLLFLSKLEAGHEELKKQPVDMVEMTQKVLQSFGPAMKSKGIESSVAISPSPFILSAEPKSFEEALTNLIDNAVKYSQPGGRIGVKAFYEGASAVVEVWDNGIGISAVDLPRIFERFYRVDKSRSRESGGSGLGLSICKHIIEKHSGRIEATSIPQKGSAFRIVLPV